MHEVKGLDIYKKIPWKQTPNKEWMNQSMAVENQIRLVLYIHETYSSASQKGMYLYVWLYPTENTAFVPYADLTMYFSWLSF